LNLKGEKMSKILSIENAKIIWRNFSGKTSRYNRNGLRTFNVIIPPDMAKVLFDEGWNVKWLRPRDESVPEERDATIQVKVQFDNRPPKVIMISGTGNKTQLTDETIGLLDYADIASVDVAIRPYSWSVDGKTGIAGYLKTLYVVLNEDEFQGKYGGVETESDFDGDYRE